MLQGINSFPLDDLFPEELDLKNALSVLPLLDHVARNAVVRALPNHGGKIALAYSGGIDSSICQALVSKKEEEQRQTSTETNYSYSSLCLGAHGSKDLVEQRSVGGQTIFPLKIVEVEKDRVEEAAKKVAQLVTVQSISHLEDCVAFYLIAEEAKYLGAHTLISANGPDELFCGYDRFRRIIDLDGYAAAEEEIERALDIANNLGKNVKLLLSEFGISLVEPFLDSEFVAFSLKIPTTLKIARGNDRLRKRIWRAYGRLLGLSEQTVLKEKKAMQYSMGIHKIVLSMIKTNTIKLEKDGEKFS